jgi:hypothetical protein
LRVGEVFLQPTDELSHDDDPAVSFLNYVEVEALGMGD